MDVVLTTHVDDFSWACTESGHAVVDRLLTRFEVGRKEEGRLRFCGKQFDVSGHGILLDVEDNTRKTTYIAISKHRNPTDPVTRVEEKQLRSVKLDRASSMTGNFIPGIQATVQHQGSCCFDRERGEQGAGARTKWNGPEASLQERAIQTSGARRTDHIRRFIRWRTGNQSQQGRIHFLVPAYQPLDPKCCDYDVVILSFSSTATKRVCRATLQAETYALQNAQEAGDRVRALLAELYGHGTTGPDWHDASRRAIPHVMLSDCRNLVANLNTEVPSRGSRQKTANRARRHAPIDIRWRRRRSEYVPVRTRCRTKGFPNPAQEVRPLHPRGKKNSSRP